MNPLSNYLNTLKTKSKTTPMSMPFVPPKTTPNMSVAPKTDFIGPKKLNMSVKPTPPTSNIGATSPAKTNYVNQVVKPLTTQSPTQNSYDTTTGLLTEYGKIQGLPEVNAPKITEPKKAVVPENAYISYLKTIFNPEQAKLAQQKKESDYKRLADIQNRIESLSLSGRHKSENAFDAPGGLKSGAEIASEGITRGTNRELADLGVQESAALRAVGLSEDIYSNLIGKGKELFDYEIGLEEPISVGGVLYQKQPDGTYKSVAGGESAEGFTLGKDQVRYDSQGNIIAGNIPTGGTSSSYIAGADPTVDSWVKWVQAGGDVTKVPEEYRNQVVQGTVGSPKPQSEISKQVVSIISDLLANQAFDSIFGPIDQFLGGTLGPQAILAKNKYNQLKGLLSLDNIKYLKGTGAISDAEQKLLANAASSLSRGLYGEQARQEIIKLRDDLTKLQSETPVVQNTNTGGGLYDW